METNDIAVASDLVIEISNNVSNAEKQIIKLENALSGIGNGFSKLLPVVNNYASSMKEVTSSLTKFTSAQSQGATGTNKIAESMTTAITGGKNYKSIMEDTKKLIDSYGFNQFIAGLLGATVAETSTGTAAAFATPFVKGLSIALNSMIPIVGIVIGVVSALIPVFSDMADKGVESSEKINSIVDSVKKTTEGLSLLKNMDTKVDIATNSKEVLDEVQALRDSFGSLLLGSESSVEAKENIESSVGDMITSMKKAREAVLTDYVMAILSSNDTDEEKAKQIQELSDSYKEYANTLDTGKGALVDLLTTASEGNTVTAVQVSQAQAVTESMGMAGISYQSAAEGIEFLRQGIDEGIGATDGFKSQTQEVADVLLNDVCETLSAASEATIIYNGSVAESNENFTQNLSNLQTEVESYQLLSEKVDAFFDGYDAGTDSMIDKNSELISVEQLVSEGMFTEWDARQIKATENCENLAGTFLKASIDRYDELSEQETNGNTELTELADAYKNDMLAIVSQLDTDTILEMQRMNANGQIELDSGTLEWLSEFMQFKGDVNNMQEESGTQAVDSFSLGWDSKLSTTTEAMTQHLNDGMVNGVNNKQSSFQTAAYNYAAAGENGVKDQAEISSPSKKWATLGDNMGQGMINGLNDKSGSLYNAATSIANSFLNVFRSLFDTHSPSRATYKIMAYVGEGAVLGLDSKLQAIRDKSSEFAGASMQSMTGGLYQSVANTANTSSKTQNFGPIVIQQPVKTPAETARAIKREMVMLLG